MIHIEVINRMAVQGCHHRPRFFFFHTFHSHALYHATEDARGNNFLNALIMGDPRMAAVAHPWAKGIGHVTIKCVICSANMKHSPVKSYAMALIILTNERLGTAVMLNMLVLTTASKYPCTFGHNKKEMFAGAFFWSATIANMIGALPSWCLVFFIPMPTQAPWLWSYWDASVSAVTASPLHGPSWLCRCSPNILTTWCFARTGFNNFLNWKWNWFHRGCWFWVNFCRWWDCFTFLILCFVLRELRSLLSCWPRPGFDQFEFWFIHEIKDAI